MARSRYLKCVALHCREGPVQWGLVSPSLQVRKRRLGGRLEEFSPLPAASVRQSWGRTRSDGLQSLYVNEPCGKNRKDFAFQINFRVLFPPVSVHGNRAELMSFPFTRKFCYLFTSLLSTVSVPRAPSPTPISCLKTLPFFSLTPRSLHFDFPAPSSRTW